MRALATPRSRAAADRGTLHRIHPGVYSVNAPPLSMHARFLAATKATNGVLSHYSAAVLWRLVHYDPNGPVHVTVPSTRARDASRASSSTAPAANPKSSAWTASRS